MAGRTSYKKSWRVAWLAIAWLAAWPLAAQTVDAPVDCPACNGSPLLCDRRYNEVAYATTHNAMSNRQEHWLAPNQNFNLSRQLNDGVRALMLDLHYFLGRVYLAHGNVLWGHKSLADGCRDIRLFLDSHPAEVLTLILESRVRPGDIAAAFNESGLTPYLYAHQPGQPFPTLRMMIAAGKRLVVFTDQGGGAYPWLHPLWSYCVETPWKAKRPEDLNSHKERGDERNPLLIANHFLTYPVASPRLAHQVNHNPFFMTRMQRLTQETGRIPNFIVVDYYDIGNLFEVVDTVNGLPWTQRRTVPDAPPAANVIVPFTPTPTTGDVNALELAPGRP